MSKSGLAPRDPRQLPLEFPSPSAPAAQAAPRPVDAAVLERLAAHLREADAALGTARPPEVEIRLRRTRSTLASLRLAPGAQAAWRLTLNAELVESEPRAALDLALWLLHKARRRRSPQDLLRRVQELRSRQRPLPVQRRLAGPVQDPALEARLRRVAEQARPGCDPAGLPAVCWVASRSRRVLARYDSRAHRVEVHAALAHPSVPMVVLDNLLHHELLHAWLDPVRQGSRTVHHHAEFRRLERAFPGHRDALDWERRHWARLCRSHLALSRPASTEA